MAQRRKKGKPRLKLGKTTRARQPGERAAGSEAGTDTRRDSDSQEVGHKFARTFAPPELYDPVKRRLWRVEEKPGDRGPYVIELNLQHSEGLVGAIAALKQLHKAVEEIKDAPPPRPVSKTYFGWELTVQEWQALLREDERRAVEQACPWRNADHAATGV